MATPRSAATVRTGPVPATGSTRDGEWYARSPDEVAQGLAVHPAVGLSAASVSEQLRAHGPNALPEEKPRPGWLRFLEEYRSYMQIILVAAALVSFLVAEWGTAVLLLVLTVLNAVVGLRQEGEAEARSTR
jgi:Ca2+-transporting ATPase